MTALLPVYGTQYEPFLGEFGDRLTTGEETLARRQVNSQAVGLSSSGALRLTFFTARKTEQVTSVRIRTGSTAAGATPTLCRVGVFSEAANGDLTLVASTASTTSLFAAANTAYTPALQAAWTKRRGSRYAMGILVVTGAAMPTFYGITGISSGSGLDSAELATTPRLNGNLASQTDLPSSIAAGSIVASGTGMIYAVFVP